MCETQCETRAALGFYLAQNNHEIAIFRLEVWRFLFFEVLMIDKYNLNEIQYNLYTIIIIHDPKQNMFAAFKNSLMTCKILTMIIII